MSIDFQSCCDFHGLRNGCNQGRNCPARLDQSQVTHLRYQVKEQPPVTLPKWQVEAMDETMESKHD